MQVILSEMPSTLLGIYAKSGVLEDSYLKAHPEQGVMGKHQLFLHPEAGYFIMAIEKTGNRLRFSDMLRSAEASLKAVLTKKGTKAPSYSGHNYGLSIDIHVTDCMHRFSMSKAELDSFMNSYGWYCHRKDHDLGPESWHYNFFGTGGEEKELLSVCGPESTSRGLEAKIQKLYGKDMLLSRTDTDGALQKLGFKTFKDFQVKFGLPDTGTPDAKSMRTLAFCASTRDLQPLDFEA